MDSLEFPETGTIIEGVGDEIVHAVFGIFLVIAIPVLIAFLNRWVMFVSVYLITVVLNTFIARTPTRPFLHFVSVTCKISHVQRWIRNLT